MLCLEFVADEPPALVFQVGHSMLRIQKVERVDAVPYTALGWAVSDIRQTVHASRVAGLEFQRYEGMNQDAGGIWLAPAALRRLNRAFPAFIEAGDPPRRSKKRKQKENNDQI